MNALQDCYLVLLVGTPRTLTSKADVTKRANVAGIGAFGYPPSSSARRRNPLKKLALLALALSAATSVLAGTDVAVSIGINQPGVYGRINIGNAPPPVVVHSQPVVIAPSPVAVQQSPIYLYVPVAHQQNWRSYCGRYNACGQRVYFVKEQWVRERWEHEHERHGKHRGHDHKHGHDHRGKHGRGHDHH